MNKIIARLYCNPDSSGMCTDYADIICNSYKTAESHILNSIFPNGNFEGGKIIIDGSVEKQFGGGL